MLSIMPTGWVRAVPSNTWSDCATVRPRNIPVPNERRRHTGTIVIVPATSLLRSRADLPALLASPLHDNQQFVTSCTKMVRNAGAPLPDKAP